MPSTKDKRVFNREEISKILDIASSVQIHQSKTPEQGLTEKEIISIAKDAGFDSSVIQSAIRIFKKPVFDPSFNWVTGTNSIQDIITVDANFNKQMWEEILQEIRRTSKSIGNIQEGKKNYRWEDHKKDIRYTHVSLSQDKENVLFQYSSVWNGIKGFVNIFSFLVFFSFTVPALKAAGIDSAYVFLLALLGGCIGLMTLGRGILRIYFEYEKGKLLMIRNRVLRIITQ